MRRFFDSRIKSLELCFRASENSFSSSTFHTKCDGKANTLTLVETTAGHKMGGFTPVAWDSSSGYANDGTKKAFLFTLTNNEKYKLKEDSATLIYSSYRHSTYGPTFGGGHDMYLANPANSGSNYCNIGHTYDTPNGYGT